ncbi:MAG: putative ski2-type helicase [Candidatus Heimdallarchaeota archaeon LC_3]|nr:MAG: putative ski2-type helicase [Candidatus Heimdallarchaeota archaeon LC_3]
MLKISTSPIQLFHPVLKEWFLSKYPNGPTDTQSRAWNNISKRKHSLIVAPTGSGKTFAAFLAIINELLLVEQKSPLIYCLYISPLKALGNDIQKNLLIPLEEMKVIAENNGLILPEINVKIRTGDTLPKDRERMRRKPPHILITTPESAFLLLTSLRQRKNLLNLKYVIIDEIHALAGSKRGTHLTITIERLEQLIYHKLGRSFTRIALSATVNPVELIQKYLGGISPQTNEFRPVSLIRETLKKKIHIEVPLLFTKPMGISKNEIWEKIILELIEIITLYKPTLIFTNSRKLTEKIVFELNERLKSDSLVVLGHHGSLSKEKRLNTENRLKNGEIDAVIATNTLELGIDIGNIERVVQLESPKSFSASMQRIGRSGHTLSGVSRGIFLSTSVEEFLENLVISKDISKNNVEKIIIPENNYDIIIQHLISYAFEEGTISNFHSIIKTAYPFRTIIVNEVIKIAELLSRRNIGNSTENAFRWRPRIFYDPNSGRVSDGSSVIWQNSGTIPEIGQYEVILIERNNESYKIGNLDEEFVFYLKYEDIIHLGGGITSYEVISIDNGKVYVKTSENRIPTLPYWKGPKLSRSYEVGRAIGEFKDKINNQINKNNLHKFLTEDYNLFEKESKFLEKLFIEQFNKYQFISGYRKILVESFIDDENKFNFIVNSPFGYSTNNTWLWTLIRTIEEINKEFISDYSINGIVNDDMINVQIKRIIDDNEVDKTLFDPKKIIYSIDKEKIKPILSSYLRNTKFFGTLFRINCVRSLLILKQLGNRKIPIKLQRYVSDKMLQELNDPESFLVYQETINELLNSKENLNIQQLKKIYQLLESKDIELIFVDSKNPSMNILSLYTQGIPVEVPSNSSEFKSKMLQIPQYLIEAIQDRENESALFDKSVITELEQNWQSLSQHNQINSEKDLQDMFLKYYDLYWSNEIEISLESRIAENFLPKAKEIIKEWLENYIILEICIPHSNNTSLIKRYIPIESYSDFKDSYDQEILVDNRILSKIAKKYSFSLGDRFQAQKNIILKHMHYLGPITIQEITARYHFSVERVTIILEDLLALKIVVKGYFVENKPYPQYISINNFQIIKKKAISYYDNDIEPVSPAITAQFFLNRFFPFDKTRLNHSQDIIEKKIQNILFESNHPVFLENYYLSPQIIGYKTDLLNDLLKKGVIRVGRIQPISSFQETGKFNLFLKREERNFCRFISLQDLLSKYNIRDSSKINTIYYLIKQEKRLRTDQIIVSTRFSKEDVAKAILLLFSFGFISLSNFIGLRESKILTAFPFEELLRQSESLGRNKTFTNYLMKINFDLDIGYWELIDSQLCNESNINAPTSNKWIIERLIDLFGILTIDQINNLIKKNWFSKQDFTKAIRILELEKKLIKGRFVKFCRGVQYTTHQTLEELRTTELNNNFYFINSDSLFNLWNSVWKIRDDLGNILTLNSSYFNLLCVNKGKIFSQLKFTKSLKECEINILRNVDFQTIKHFFKSFLLFLKENSHSKHQKEIRIVEWNKKPILIHPIHRYLEFIGLYLKNNYLLISLKELSTLESFDEINIPDKINELLSNSSSMD